MRYKAEVRDQRLIQVPGVGNFGAKRGQGELLFRYRFP